MSLCKECISGVRHEGTPTGPIYLLSLVLGVFLILAFFVTGRIEKINGVDTYIALPEGDFPTKKAIVFLTDVFGVELNNNKLLADDFARNGFQTYMPDLFNGGARIPEDALTKPAEEFDRVKWIAEHSLERTRPTVDKVIAGLRERGITTFGAVGYCYGAKHVIDLAKENTIASAVVAHPSRFDVPGNLHELVAKSKAPLLINSCEIDPAFPAEACQQADEILGNGKYQPGYSRQHWLGCTHGFAVRGDMSNPHVKAGKEGAFKSTVEWFLKL